LTLVLGLLFSGYFGLCWLAGASSQKGDTTPEVFFSIPTYAGIVIVAIAAVRIFNLKSRFAVMLDSGATRVRAFVTTSLIEAQSTVQAINQAIADQTVKPPVPG
jgi:hypothetical protein